jgi:hypothetical protein
VADFLQRFNDLPLGLKSGALLRDEASGRLTFFDGEQENEIGLSASPAAVVSLQAGLPLLFDPAKPEAEIYAYRAGALAAPVSDVLTRHFAEVLKPAEKADLRDALYTSGYACLLLRQGLRCYRPDRAQFSLTFTHFEAARFLFGERSRLLGPGRVAILGSDGYLYELPSEAGALEGSDPKAWARSERPAPFRAAQAWPGGEIVLNLDGTLNSFSYRERKALPFKNLTGRKFRDLKAPFVWGKKLEEL